MSLTFNHAPSSYELTSVEQSMDVHIDTHTWANRVQIERSVSV